MKLLDNSDKYLLPLIPVVVLDKLGKAVDELNFIGGGSFGRVYKATLSGGEIIAVKAYKLQGDQYGEAKQLEILAENTSVKMPEVVFTYEDENTAILAMTFVEGKNVLEPVFLLRSKTQKKVFAEAVIDGMLQWHSVTNDMFSMLNFDYPMMKTQDGLGRKVNLSYPNGMISWLSGFRSDYDGAKGEDCTDWNALKSDGRAKGLDSIGVYFKNCIRYRFYALDITR